MGRLRFLQAGFIAAVLLPVLGCFGEDEKPAVDLRTALDRLLDRWEDPSPRDRLGGAAKLCEERLASAPGNVDTWLTLARLRCAKGALAEALDAANEAVARSPAKSEHLGRARVAYYLTYRRWADAHVRECSTKERRGFIDEATRKERALEAELNTTVTPPAEIQRLMNVELDAVRELASRDQAGRDAPPISAKDLDGNPLSLASLKGRVVVVDFWSTRADLYRSEIAALGSICATRKDAAIAVLGVCVDSDVASVRAFLKQSGATWPQHCDGHGWSGEVVRAWKLETAPHRYLVDPDGKIRYVDPWGDALAPAIDDMLDHAKRERAPQGGARKKPG